MQAKLSKSNNTIFSTLLHYHQGECTDKEAAQIASLIQDDPTWQKEWKRVQHFQQDIKSSNVPSPSPEVWENIHAKIKDTKPRSVWLSWLYAYPKFNFVVRTAPAMILILLAPLFLWSTFMEPSYQVITVDESSAIVLEADSYVTHHELATAQPLARESLLAFYEYEQ